MSVRLATAADLPALCQLLAQLFAQEAEFTPDHAAQQRGLAAILADPALGAILVAVEDDRVRAMVSLLYTVSTALGARVALLEDMVVDAGARGAGIGSTLLQAAIAHAQAEGCRRITLLTDGDNQAAQRFYRRHGFAPSPMRPLRRAL
ncbi:GNAT family N-acetyltransferase [Pseudomonas oryzae]|uniref:L-amino acid N-acyltransferase YncA n=1 Tax=Pseudomonas oryzae TaxID=1392877 RepID=A0A1H1LMP4_9PSED|nr:GNAT family N-acetyltransferase [Pseudomonas oryzae]SDR75864.1 L-amino acid N-acyltransferase YncA [Pseudomonas oryzae]